ncbi:MAG: MerR family transcriptional regulator [Chloroflexia bacterium]|nr:MerR family transcriptional regulator [Chloroflexia bacterium]
MFTLSCRHFEEVDLLPEPTRTRSGYRLYPEGDVTRLSFIQAAEDFGFTLGEIREFWPCGTEVKPRVPVCSLSCARSWLTCRTSFDASSA